MKYQPARESKQRACSIFSINLLPCNWLLGCNWQNAYTGKKTFNTTSKIVHQYSNLNCYLAKHWHHSNLLIRVGNPYLTIILSVLFQKWYLQPYPPRVPTCLSTIRGDWGRHVSGWRGCRVKEPRWGCLSNKWLKHSPTSGVSPWSSWTHWDIQNRGDLLANIEL